MTDSGVRLTSLHAHTEQVISGRARTQREKILECLRQHNGSLTRRMISELTRIPINAVTGRVNAMLPADGKIGLVRVAYEEVDPGTARVSEWIDLVTPEPKQREFNFG